MQIRGWLACVLLPGSFAGCEREGVAPSGAAAAAAAPTLGFEDVAPGSLPSGWAIAETKGAGTPALWRVEERADAPEGRRVVRLVETKNSGQTYNLLLCDAAQPADLVLEVRLRADAGDEDQGGGLVWRARDAENYYVARWNPLESNLRTYTVEGGKRTMLASADATDDASAWHTLRIEQRGSRTSVALDGQQLLAAEDATFTAGGRVGLWTKADAATSFDAFVIAPAE
jgi:hypothetical protein